MSYLGPVTKNFDPVINYISNGRAYDSTIGWATYADAAGAQPVDGTGGSPSVTWSRDTTTPLRQGADFNFVKDAVNRQGQGVSYDFTIDNADLAKVLTVTFDYEVLSGTYATGDLTVYLVQDTGGTPTVVQPAGYQIQSATVGTKMRQIATFQTSSSITSYRLCLHVASTSASAYSLAVDNVVVGPQVVQYGAPVTDWVAYTPTFAGVTATGVDVKYRRVGDSIEVIGKFDTTASSATTFSISLPSGLTVDTNKLPSDRTATLGVLVRATSTTQTYPGVSFGPWSVTYSSAAGSNVVTVAQSVQDTSGYIYTPTAGSTLFTAGDPGAFEFKIPILGWSSSVQMSNDTDTRVVAAKAIKTAVQSIPNNSLTKVTLSSATFDTHGGFDFANNRYVVTTPGFYRVSALFSWGNTPAGARSLRVYKNGSVDSELYNSIASSATGIRLNGVATISCVAGDYLEIYAFQDSGGALNIDGTTGAAFNYFSVERLSGPSAIAASESVTARYYASANRTPTGVKAVNYDVRVFDSHGAVTTVSGDVAGWKFTAPISGKYFVNVGSFQSAATAGGSLQIYKNGVSITSFLVPCTLANNYLNGSSIVDLIAGDFIDIRSDSTPTLNNVTAQVLTVHIYRVGN